MRLHHRSAKVAVAACLAAAAGGLPLGLQASEAIQQTPAPWVHVETERLGTRYMDPGTLVRSGDVVRVETLVRVHDVKRMLGAGSIRATEEVDCAQQRSRRLRSVSYAEDLGRGDVVSRHDEPEAWADATRHASMLRMLRAVCPNMAER